jgi:hypothetical protein
MSNRRADELVTRLQALARENAGSPSRSGDVIATEQLAAFGELMVVLARQLDQAQHTVKNLTWIIFVLTVLIAADAGIRVYDHFKPPVATQSK